ncbi:hypothetical protein BH23PLA1_BH23PLA1_24990 [soil metagenome]
MKGFWLQCLAVAVGLLQGSALGQEAAHPAPDPAVMPMQWFLPGGGGSGPRLGISDEVGPSPPTSEPNPFASAIPADSRFLQDVKVAYTFLPGGGADGFGNNDFELSFTRALSWTFFSEAPLLVTPGFGLRLWEGPRSDRTVDWFGQTLDLPPRVYDLYLDFGWKPRLREWLFADFGITPGAYTDFGSSGHKPFRLRGRALAIVAFSERFQIVGGFLYINRNRYRAIPAGGLLWFPNPDTKVELVFPQPRLSRRITTVGSTEWWGYLAGEFGGGTWSIERADGRGDSIDYNDLRLIVGAEWVTPGRIGGRIEAGYVFGREIISANIPPNFSPDSTAMVRIGLTY